MSHGTKGDITSPARDWVAELRPINRPSTPWPSRMSDSSGHINPMVVPTAEVQMMAAARLRR